MAAVIEEQNARRRVLDAAAELFVSQGYAGTTLRQIAAAVGIQAGSIYHHFDAKQDLFVAVLHEGIVVMVDAFDETATAITANASTEAHVVAHVRAHLSAVFEHGPYTTAHVTSFSSAPAEVRIRVVPERDRYEQQWRTLFERLLPTMPANERRLHRLILFGAMNTTAEWFDPAGDLSIDELASTISDQFLNGVAA